MHRFRNTLQYTKVKSSFHSSIAFVFSYLQRKTNLAQTYFTILLMKKMLSYVKQILTRVSFDALLFEKELRKAISMLIAEEVQELQRWCYANYRSEHEAILNRCFVTT